MAKHGPVQEETILHEADTGHEAPHIVLGMGQKMAMGMGLDTRLAMRLDRGLGIGLGM